MHLDGGRRVIYRCPAWEPASNANVDTEAFSLARRHTRDLEIAFQMVPDRALDLTWFAFAPPSPFDLVVYASTPALSAVSKG